MSTSLKKHISPLHESFLDKFIAEFGGLTGFTTSSQENSTLFILNRHKVGRNLDVYYVGSVAMCPEIVHKQVMCIVDEEVKSIEHVSIILQDRNLES